MKFEKEYTPKEPVEDKVFVLKNGRAVEVDIPDDDDGDSFDEEDEAPHVDYD